MPKRIYRTIVPPLTYNSRLYPAIGISYWTTTPQSATMNTSTGGTPHESILLRPLLCPLPSRQIFPASRSSQLLPSLVFRHSLQPRLHDRHLREMLGQNPRLPAAHHIVHLQSGLAWKFNYRKEVLKPLPFVVNSSYTIFTFSVDCRNSPARWGCIPELVTSVLMRQTSRKTQPERKTT